MKLHILSDLHLGFQGMDRPETDADVVVLAGDIARPRAAIEWATGFGKPVIYVLGNHEFYGGSLQGTLRELQQLTQGTPVQVLNNSSVVIAGVRFLGSTLWTDFELLGSGPEKQQAMAQAQEFMRDFSRIQVETPEGDRTLSPQHTSELFASNTQWLERELLNEYAGPTVVITHHAPSPQSIHPRFAGSVINACFVSRAEHLLGRDRVSLWVHGHTHDSFDYVVSGTRVVCNPRGYSRDGVNENALFNPDLTIDIR